MVREALSAVTIENRPLWAWQAFYGDGAPYEWWDRTLSRGRVGLSYHEARRAVIDAYCFSIPTDEALDTLAARSPLVEIGAGLGFWAAMLVARGADIVCYDHKPPRPGGSHDDETSNWWWPDATPYVTVHHGTERMLDRHGDRTLLLRRRRLLRPARGGVARGRPDRAAAMGRHA